MSPFCRFVILVAYFCSCAIVGETKEDYFIPCRASDPAFEKCLITTAQKVLPIFVKGIPDLDIESFKNFKVEDVHEIQPSLQIHFTNITISGSENTNITSLKLDPIKRKIVLHYSNTGTMNSKYKADGRLLVLPVTGDGKATIKMNIDYAFKLYYDVVKGKDGSDRIKVVKHKVNFTPNDIDFVLTNMFNGNKELGDVIVKFINESWRDIFPEIGTPVMIKVTNRIVKQIGKFMSAFPAEEVLLP